MNIRDKITAARALADVAECDLLVTVQFAEAAKPLVAALERAGELLTGIEEYLDRHGTMSDVRDCVLTRDDIRAFLAGEVTK